MRIDNSAWWREAEHFGPHLVSNFVHYLHASSVARATLCPRSSHYLSSSLFILSASVYTKHCLPVSSTSNTHVKIYFKRQLLSVTSWPNPFQVNVMHSVTIFNHKRLRWASAAPRLLACVPVGQNTFPGDSQYGLQSSMTGRRREVRTCL